MKKYVVAKGRSILLSDLRHLKEGRILSAAQLEKAGWPADRVAEGIKAGHLIELSEQAVANLLGASIPQEAPSSPGGGTGHGPWNYDPAALQGKSLEQLNAIVLGVDPNIPAFETSEEAIAHLSANFKSTAT